MSPDEGLTFLVWVEGRTAHQKVRDFLALAGIEDSEAKTADLVKNGVRAGHNELLGRGRLPLCQAGVRHPERVRGP